MGKTLIYIIYTHELAFGILGLLISFLYLLIVPMSPTIWRCLPLALSWISVFLIGDNVNKHLGNGSIFPHRKDQLHKLKRLAAAGFFMNLINDASGAFMTRLWYYPGFDPIWYLLFFAPIGYMLFGIILYIFYKVFRRHWEYLVRAGRMSRTTATVYQWIMYMELIIGSVGLVVSWQYYMHLITTYGVRWYEIFARVDMPVSVPMVFFSWLSIFFLLEFACFMLGRETLSRDCLRGNFLPLVSIVGASVLCIVFVELFNAPFQIWVFHNWPLDHIRFFDIPLVAYLVWPSQYLLLLPIIRLFDGKNEENVW